MAEIAKTWKRRRGSSFEELCVGKPKLLRLMSLAAHFLLGFLGGGVRMGGECAPFGIALAARAGGGVAGIACVLGASLGYLLGGGLSPAVRYIAGLMLVYTASFAFRDTELGEKPWFIPSLAAFATALTGTIRILETRELLESILRLSAEAMIAGLSAYFFTLALDEERGETEQEELRSLCGTVLLACCAEMTLCRVVVWDTLSLGRLVAVFAVMVCAFGGGAAAGCSAGLVLGAAAELSGQSAACMAMSWGAAGLLAGLTARRGRLLFVLLFSLVSAMVLFRAWESAPSLGALCECFASSVVFLCLPAHTMNQLTAALRIADGEQGESGARLYAARRTGELAGAFRELYETVRQSAECEYNDADIATVYDRAAESVCAACEKKGECWHRNYMDTLSMLNDAGSAARSEGLMRREHLPERFTENCPRTEEFLEAVNAELRAMTYRRRLRARLEENRTAAYSQFRTLSDVLDTVADELRCGSGPDALAQKRVTRYLNSLDLDAQVSVFRDRRARLRVMIRSAELPILLKTEGYLDKLSSLLGVRLCRPAGMNREDGRLVLLEAEPLQASVGIAAMKKEGESVSGDRGTYFKTEQGVLCVLLSDGMGSGEDAAKESVSTVRILERFLRAGVEPSAAMRLLNSMVLLKNGDEWGYATVDLMCIDLFTGETAFYKYGAAPSYIRSGHSVRRVRGVIPAAGILSGDGEEPDVIRMTLHPGGAAIVASDGVIGADGDAWVREALLGFEDGDTRALARRIVRAAVQKYGSTDDMTVLAVKVEARQ